MERTNSNLALGSIDGKELLAYQIIVGANSLGYHWLIRYWLKQDPQTHYVNQHRADEQDSRITSIDMAYGLAENAWKKLLDVPASEGATRVVSDGTDVQESATE